MEQLHRGLRPGAAAALRAQHDALRGARDAAACWSRASRSPTRSRACAGKGRDAVFLLVLVAMMLPPQVTVVPLYVMWAKLDLVGTLCAADRPQLVRRRVLDLPAAPVLPDDPRGVPRRRARRRLRRVADPATVVLRLAKPAIAAVALFMFLYASTTSSGRCSTRATRSRNWTLSLGLAQFRTLHQVQWNLTMAATIIVMAPVIVLVLRRRRRRSSRA